MLGLLAALAIAIVLTWRLGLDAYRGRIEQIVSRATGRPFHLRGPIALALAPLAIVTGPAELDDPPGMTGPPLASWRAARIRLELLPLLHHRLVIGSVRLDGLQVHLQRGADGRSNWSNPGDIRAPGAAERAAGSGNPASAAAREPLARFGGVTIDTIHLGGLEIRDGTLDLDDRLNARRVRVSEWQLEVGAVRLARNVEIGPVRTSARVWSSALPAAAAGYLPSGDGHAPSDAGLPLRVQLSGIALSLDPLVLTIPRWSLQLANPPPARSASAAQLEGTLSIADAGHLNAHGPITGRIESVRGLAAMLGIESVHAPDPQALGTLTLSGDWSLADGALALRSLRMHLDATTLTGHIVRETAAGHPLIKLDLHGDRIDLDRYLAGGGAHGKPFELPVAALRALRIEGSMTFDEARFAGTEMKRARIAIPASGSPAPIEAPRS